MKGSWLIAGIFAVLLILLFSMARKAIFLGTKQGKSDVRVTAMAREGATDTLEIEIAVWHSTRDYRITEITLPTDLFVALDARTPEGFRNEPMPADKGGSDQEKTEKWNQENVRWVGSYALRPNTPVLFRIPAAQPARGTGKIHFHVEGEDSDGKPVGRPLDVKVTGSKPAS